MVLACCSVDGINPYILESNVRSSPLHRLYGLPALLPEEYDPAAIDRYFKANPTLAFQRAGVLVGQFASLVIGCIGEMVIPPVERRDIRGDEQLEDFPSMHIVNISNAEYSYRKERVT